MKKLVLSVLIVSFTLCHVNRSFAQLSEGGVPMGFGKFLSEKEIPFVSMPDFDVEAMLAEDEIIHPQKIRPYRFGNNFDVYLTPDNSGKWTTLENGDRLWQLGIHSAGAYSINLTFNDYVLPEGAKLFVYNQQRDFVIGAFTNANNQEDRMFATDLVKGEHIILEYFEPNAVKDQGSLIISRVTHAYRDLFSEDFARAFGNSGACNMNVICPDGTPWVDQTKSAVMLVTSGNGFCSGALINNTQNNGIPYVLTANHCYSDPSVWVFRFNWQSATCSNPGSSPTYQSLSGAVLKAKREPSDFCLVQINTAVPSNYNAYFSGWNNSSNPPSSSVSIHHPSGDIKKISFDDHPAIAIQEMGSIEPNSSWKVIWDRSTTTEGGSSGSPLFDQNKRIIGQLWGGSASCSQLTAPDYYGRLFNSWEPLSSNSTNQLKFWLDPNNTGIGAIDGYDPNATNFAMDAGIQSIASPVSGSSTCYSTVTPQVLLRNAGSTILTSCTINYQMDGGIIQTYNWTGSLASNTSVGVTLNAVSGLLAGSHVFKSYTTAPNSNTDQNPVNDTSSVSFSVLSVALTPQSEGFQAVFPTVNWSIGNPNNNITWVKVATAGGFGTSSSSAKMDNYTATTNISGESDFIYSPLLDFTNAITPIELTFDVAYARYSATYFDTLKVQTTSNCGSTWTQVFSKGNTTLATAPDNSSSGFVPSSAQWRTETVNLDSYAGQSGVRIAFENKSGWGQNLYLDNINITSAVPTSSSNTSISSAIEIYPNPSDGIFSAEIKLSNASEKLSIDVYSVLGKIVYSTSENNSKGGIYKIDLSHLSSGVYIIEVISGNDKKMKKLILNN